MNRRNLAMTGALISGLSFVMPVWVDDFGFGLRTAPAFVAIEELSTGGKWAFFHRAPFPLSGQGVWLWPLLAVAALLFGSFGGVKPWAAWAATTCAICGVLYTGAMALVWLFPSPSAPIAPIVGLVGFCLVALFARPRTESVAS